ncbi:hypothetical protein HYFRA_00008222 [Hymenoscyphus fraxineus]|uniref:Major facilitator superfamily (MFS) profile domain-containing protein n=1 Tax=Hymenoscyphus fraxineus TaxID=746836 RepID=A0A9N9Q086_9HELO|nr:hypothetical protein HYFRA_00008222 [Hymenoscyphus fraxineus]
MEKSPRLSSSDIEQATDVSSGGCATSNESPAPPALPTFTPMQYRKLIWKLDLRLLPALFCLWFVSLIDRINIGSANIYGIQKDLKMDPRSNDFNIALLVVQVGLITCEVPSNYLLKKTSPPIILAATSILLAICTIGQGVITNFSGLLAVRFFVGVFEAGLIPANPKLTITDLWKGSVYVLSQYYPRYELQWRLSMLMVGNAVSSAFGGLLAFAIADIKSSNGYSPWRWIFIIEGCMTVGVTILAYPFLPGWPATAKWLSVDEKAVLADRIQRQGIVGKMEVLNSKTMKRIVLDWKIYLLFVVLCFPFVLIINPRMMLTFHSGAVASCTTVTVYSTAIFAPTIIKQFEPTASARYVQALVIPIFIAASVGCLAAAFASDKLKHRAGFALLGYLLIISGAVILIYQDQVSSKTRYGALYLLAVGSYISLPMLWTMLVNNVSGSYKIGYAVAMEVGLGNVGGIASALLFQGKQAPKYRSGYKTILGMSCAAVGMIAIYTLALWYENRARDAGKRDARLSDPDVDNLGDDHPQFRYGY